LAIPRFAGARKSPCVSKAARREVSTGFIAPCLPTKAVSPPSAARTSCDEIHRPVVQCPQRITLDAFGDLAKRDEINAFVRLLWERGTLFERETIAKLGQPFTDLSKASDSDRERLTRAAMARGDALIYGGCIAADDLRGVPDLLRKEPGGYVPGDIKAPSSLSLSRVISQHPYAIMA
jgi:hypothetical protein